jgi:integration host factor subunit alpha
MRINLTKKDIVNSLYMQIGYTKKISENLLEDVFELILDNLKRYKMVKIAKFGTFILREKKSRIGRNPKTKEKKLISQRKVVLFKPSKELKKKVNF